MTDPTGIDAIRAWLADHPSQGHPVRQEAFFLSYSALVARSLSYGLESGYDEYTAHELIEVLRITNGRTADFFAKAGFGRALAENHHELLAVIAGSGLADEFVAWTRMYATMPLDGCLTEMAAMISLEERQMARLLTGRRFPGAIAADWLDQDPVPSLAHALLREIIAQRPDLHAFALDYLRSHPSVLYYRDPDVLLAPLVAMSTSAPQVLLPAFDGAYGDGTVIAAAEWHLEHDQPGPARELAERLRPLSTHRDRALRVIALASLELADPAAVERACAAFIDPSLIDDVRLHQFEQHVGSVDPVALRGVLDRCGHANAERFYRALVLALRTGDRTGALQACRAKAEIFAEHPTVREIIRTVMQGAASA